MKNLWMVLGLALVSGFISCAGCGGNPVGAQPLTAVENINWGEIKAQGDVEVHHGTFTIEEQPVIAGKFVTTWPDGIDLNSERLLTNSRSWAIIYVRIQNEAGAYFAWQDVEMHRTRDGMKPTWSRPNTESGEGPYAVFKFVAEPGRHMNGYYTISTILPSYTREVWKWEGVPINEGTAVFITLHVYGPRTGYPEGCSSSEGFSSTTGARCGVVQEYPEEFSDQYPWGCLGPLDYNPLTGKPCQ